MSLLPYSNVAKHIPKFNQRPKSEQEAFLLEIKALQSSEQARKKKLRGGIYRPGQAPTWISDEEKESSESDGDLIAQINIQPKQFGNAVRRNQKVSRSSFTDTVDITEKRTITRAQILSESDDYDDNDNDVIIKKESVGPITIDRSKLDEPSEPEDEGDEEEKEADRRRQRARAKAKMREKEGVKKNDEFATNNEIKKESDSEESYEEDDESEYETDTDEEDEFMIARKLPKPVYVPKKDRDTLEERERIEAVERALEEDKRKRLKERKQATLQLIVQEIRRDAEEEKGEVIIDDEKLPPDDDDVDEEEELGQWKIRELKRIKRDREEREKLKKIEEEVEKRRGMTDLQIKLDNRNNPIRQKARGNYRFLQKYYHPGAFFQGDESKDIHYRDFNQAVGADRTTDRSLLPEVMQVKNWGLKSRVKWTHLVNEDTTNHEHNPWAQAHRTTRQLAGIYNVAKRLKR